jgi:hypothetical protein
MLNPSLIESLSELPAPVLTIYLDTNLANAANRRLEPAYLTSLESQAKVTEESLYPEKREAFREQVQRAEGYLRAHPPRSKAVVIFSGPGGWEFVPLEADVEDEVHWGTPDLAQLLWLLDEHKPYGIVVVGRKRTLFFLYSLGEMLELEDKEFILEPSKEKEMGPPSRAFGVRVSRGTNRDVYEHHRDAEYARYYRQIAKNIGHWCGVERLQSLFLLALPEVLSAIQKEIPETLRERIVPIEEDLGWVSRSELHERIEPIVLKHQGQQQMALVDLMLGDQRGFVLGIDETLIRLQRGTIRNIVAVKGLDASLKRCGECLWVNRTADPVCPACGRERHTVNLRGILPELVRRHKASLEVVSGEAARKLRGVGGIGAWLREFEQKEYSASA